MKFTNGNKTKCKKGESSVGSMRKKLMPFTRISETTMVTSLLFPNCVCGLE